jgi:glucokinase
LFNDEHCAIGIDVGGTKIAAGLVLSSGKIVQQKRVPTNAHLGGEHVSQTVTALVEFFLEQARVLDKNVLGIGLGVAELVDAKGQITSSQTIKWQGVDIQKYFSSYAPTIVESDVRAAALAESLFGAGQGLEHFLYVTVGTGISHTFVLSGHPFAGARGNALVFASSPYTLYDQPEPRQHLPLEMFSSGPALVQRYNQMTSKTLAEGTEVVAASERGDEVAHFVIESAGAALGVGVGWLVNVLDPYAVIVGGGLGVSGGLYWQAFERAAREHIWAEATRTLPIQSAALGEDAGLIGAASSLFTRLLKP